MNTYKLCAFADEADGTVEGQIRALTENGIPYLELRGLETGSAIALSDRGARELKKRLDDAGIAVWSMGSPIGKIGVTDPSRRMWSSSAERWRLARSLARNACECSAFICRRTTRTARATATRCSRA